MQPNVQLGGEADTAGTGEVPGDVGGGGVYSLIGRGISGERWMYAACVGAALVFLGMTLHDMQTRTGRERQVVEQQVVKGVSASELLRGHTDLLGRKYAPYTLVEFGDYECPPCRAAQPKIVELLRLLEGRVNLDFRNLPLVDIHPYALSAAYAAELARTKGNYWKEHQDLFSSRLESRLSEHDILPELIQASIRSRIRDDVELARLLKVDSTPTFFLCLPGGKVIRLKSLSSVQNFVH